MFEYLLFISIIILRGKRLAPIFEQLTNKRKPLSFEGKGYERNRRG
jgi:hypothetical protein